MIYNIKIKPSKFINLVLKENTILGNKIKKIKKKKSKFKFV